MASADTEWFASDPLAFVGRERERADIRRAIAAPARRIVHVHGPAGAGKTSLLARCRAEALDDAVAVVAVDLATLVAEPEPLVATLARLQGCAAELDALVESFAGPTLLTLDTLERGAAMLDWLFDRLLAQLPASVTVLLAGREPLPTRLRTDLRWREALDSVLLRGFSPEESATLLGRMQVDARDHAAIHEFAQGHPLALVLTAEDLRASGQRFAHLATGSVIQQLVERFTHDIRDPERARALEAAAVVRVVNESLLRALVGRDDCRETFAWLRGLSFMQVTREGLRPHDLVRRALLDDLSWRDPDRFGQLRERARAYYSARDPVDPTRDDVRAMTLLYDLSFLHSQNPIARTYFDWSSDEPIFPDRPRPEELERAVALATSHEGEAAGRWLRAWFERQPEHCHVFRNQRLDALAYHCAPLLGPEDLAREADDPALATLARALDERGPLRGHERAIVTRFWFGFESYQQVTAVTSRMWLHMVRRYGLTPALACGAVVFADLGFWQIGFTYMGFSRVDGELGMMVHDFRARPFERWLELLSAVERTSSPVPHARRPPPAQTLDRDAFATAVKEALRSHEDSQRLAASPLIGARFVREIQADPSEAPDRLRRALYVACERLRHDVGARKYHRALVAYFLRSAPSQDIAADTLGVAPSSFRRHLRRGLELVVDALWEIEIGQRPPESLRAGSGAPAGDDERDPSGE